jgi:hypothetical protein
LSKVEPTRIWRGILTVQDGDIRINALGSRKRAVWKASYRLMNSDPLRLKQKRKEVPGYTETHCIHAVVDDKVFQLPNVLDIQLL